MLSRRHGTKRVRASLVYNEFIAHKTHTHMNSTQWETLTSFVLYLGKVRIWSQVSFGVFVYRIFVRILLRCCVYTLRMLCVCQLIGGIIAREQIAEVQYE